jgi:hypothetical protein
VPLFWGKTGLSGGRKQAVFLPFWDKNERFWLKLWGYYPFFP